MNAKNDIYHRPPYSYVIWRLSKNFSLLFIFSNSYIIFVDTIGYLNHNNNNYKISVLYNYT